MGGRTCPLLALSAADRAVGLGGARAAASTQRLFHLRQHPAPGLGALGRVRSAQAMTSRCCSSSGRSSGGPTRVTLRRSRLRCWPLRWRSSQRPRGGRFSPSAPRRLRIRRSRRPSQCSDWRRSPRAPAPGAIDACGWGRLAERRWRCCTRRTTWMLIEQAIAARRRYPQRGAVAFARWSAPLIDPNLGILVNFPWLTLALVIAIVALAWRSPRALRTPAVLASIAAVAVFLVSFSQIPNVNHGGTPGISRYGLWLIPMTLSIFALCDGAEHRPRLAWLSVIAGVSCVWCVSLFHPEIKAELPPANEVPPGLSGRGFHQSTIRCRRSSSSRK